MRAFWPVVVVAVVGCGPGAKPHPSPPVPVELSNAATRGCADAAAGLERATRGIRAPDESVLTPMRKRCVDDHWPAAAIECFTTMRDDELGRCGGLLAERPRDAMFAVLGGNEPDRASIAISRAKLSTLKVGIAECDRFVAAVAAVLTCEQMPIETRLALGTETADFWSLPTSGLPADAQAKMSRACNESLQALQQQAVDVGCMP